MSRAVIHEKFGIRRPFDKLWKMLLILNKLEVSMAYSKSSLFRQIGLSQGQCNASLIQLVEEGMVEETPNSDVFVPGRENKTYKITSKGVTVLRTWSEITKLFGV